MMSSSPVKPASRRRASSRERYRSIFGPTYAFTSVVDVRSNSGADGITSCESEIITSGSSSRAISHTRRSWVGFTNENSNTTARDWTPCFRIRRHARRTASSSSGTTTLPSKSSRSGTP